MALRLNPSFIVAYCIGIVTALITGIVLAGHDWGVHVGAVISAGLGALIAVFGAAWMAEHREASQRKELLAILIDGLGSLGRATTQALQDLEGTKTPAEAVRPVVARWETIAVFEPYRELGNFHIVRHLLDVGAECRALYAYTEEPAPQPAPTDARSWIFGRSPNRPRKSAAAQLQAVAEACQRAMPPLDGALR